MTFLPPLKNRLTDYIGKNNLGLLLEAFRQLLVDHSESRKEVILYENRYNSTVKNRLKNIISYDEAQRELSQINVAILALIDKLTEEDFKLQDQEAIDNLLNDLENNTKKKIQNQGNILHRIPEKMEVNKWTECLIRIAYEENQLYKDLKKEAGDVRMKRPIGNKMRVEIIQIKGEKKFEIDHISSKKQFISWTHPTDWVINIKPLKKGVHKLYLRIGIIEEKNGKEIPNELVVNKAITIVSSAPENTALTNPLKVYKSGISFFPLSDQLSSEAFNAGVPAHLNNKGLAASLFINHIIAALITLFGGGAVALGYFDYQAEKKDLDGLHSKIEQYEKCQPAKAIMLIDEFIEEEGFWFSRKAKEKRRLISTTVPWSKLEGEALCDEIDNYLAICPKGQFAEQARQMKQQLSRDSICVSIIIPIPFPDPPEPKELKLNIDYTYQKEKNRLRLKIIDGVPNYHFTMGYYGRIDTSIIFSSSGNHYIDIRSFKKNPGEYRFRITDKKGTVQKGKFIIELDTSPLPINPYPECYEEIRGRAKGAKKCALYFYHSTKSYVSKKMKYITFADNQVKQTIDEFYEYGSMDVANPENCPLPSSFKNAPAVLLYCSENNDQIFIPGYQQASQFDSLLMNFQANCFNPITDIKEAPKEVKIEQSFNRNPEGTTYVLLETKDKFYKWVPRALPEGYGIQVLAVEKYYSMVTAAECLQSIFPEKRIYIDFKDNYYKIFIGSFKERKKADYFKNNIFYKNQEACIKPYLKNKLFVKNFN